MIVCERDVPIYILYKYMNTTKDKFSGIKIAKRARKLEDVNYEIFVRIILISFTKNRKKNR